MIQEINKHSKRCFIGLGSNLDNPIQHIQKAIVELKTLKQCEWIGASSLYQSAPVGPVGQDDYINAVVCFNSTLKPEELLDQLQLIENRHDRVRAERWGARTLDLDILLIDDIEIQSNRLIVPHPYITVRNFVLIPLAELAGSITIKNSAIADLIANCPPGNLNKIQTNL